MDVDEAAPSLRDLQRRGAAEAPDRGLLGCLGQRSGGHRPHGNGGVREGLQKREQALRRRVQGQHPCGVLGELRRQLGLRDRSRAQLGEAGGEGRRRVADDDPVVERHGRVLGDRAPMVPVMPGRAGRSLGGGPVPHALERVGGQVDHAPAPMQGRPVDVATGGVDVAECAQSGAHLVAVAVLGRNAGRQQRGERGVGADLDDADGIETRGAVGEAHGVAQVPHPVVDVLRAVLGAARARDGDVVEGRGGAGQPRDEVGQRLDGLVHVCGVERVADGEALDPHPAFGVLGGEGGHGVLVAGDDGRVGGVDRRDLHPGGQSDGLLTQADDGHRTARGHRAHEPGPLDDQRGGVGEGQYPRDVRGDDLADGVADDHVRAHTPGFEEANQRDLEGEDRGLGELGLVQAGLVLDQHVPHRHREQCDDLVPRPREDRERRRQITAHARTLRALAGEREGGAPARDRCGGDGVEPGEQLVPGGADDDGAALEGRPRRGQ